MVETVWFSWCHDLGHMTCIIFATALSFRYVYFIYLCIFRCRKNVQYSRQGAPHGQREKADIVDSLTPTLIGLGRYSLLLVGWDIYVVVTWA